jgi:hypothetical protein
VFEKFKKNRGGDDGGSSGRPRAAVPRRPAQPRKPGAKGAKGKDAPVDLSAPDPRPASSLARMPTPREIPCPNCGEPMLSGWGTTCGNCRPALVAPKTLFLSPGQSLGGVSRASEGMSLGWLVVVSTLDQRHRGALLELDQERSTLSRGEAPQPREPGLFEFSDIFMSSGHAVITRPRTGDRNGAFSIKDREGAPTANGTFVNSRRVLPGETVGLADGDVIKVGATQLVFRSLWLPGADARIS